MSEFAAVGSRQFVASTSDGAVTAAFSLVSGVVGIQFDRDGFARVRAMANPGHQLAVRVMACCETACTEARAALRADWEAAHMDPAVYEDMPGPADVAAARARLAQL